MSEQFTEVTRTSWGARIKNAIAGIVIGFLLFFGSFGLIWWNEGRSVDRIKTLDEGRGAVISVAAERVDPNNESALVHISGTATTQQVLGDSLFGVKENALKLRRKVEMYQWKESSKTTTKTNVGGSETQETTYSYAKEWSESIVDSSTFKIQEGHQNPQSMPYKTTVLTAKNINVGAYELTGPFVSQIDFYEPYALTQKNAALMDERLKKSFKLSGDQYFFGDPVSPAVGAMRITYQIVPPQDVTIVGQQSRNAVTTYTAKRGTINLLGAGVLDSDQMFSRAEAENKLWTWLLRLGGFVMMWLGLMSIFNVLKVLGDVLPILGSILGVGIGIVTFVVALVLSFVTMAIAWIFYRPLIGGMLIVLAAMFMFGGFKTIRSRMSGRSDDNLDASDIAAAGVSDGPIKS
jgi:hypothetical protein